EAMELVHPEDRVRVAESARSVIFAADPADWSGEFRVIRPTGEVRWLVARGRALGTPRPGSGLAGRRFVGVLLDVTRQKRVERELAQNEERARRLAGELEAIQQSLP